MIFVFDQSTSSPTQIPHWQSLLSKRQNCDLSEEGEEYHASYQHFPWTWTCQHVQWTWTCWYDCSVLLTRELFEKLQTWHPGDGEPAAVKSNFTTETTSTSTETETGSYKKQNGLDYPVNVARWGHSSSPCVYGLTKIQGYSLCQECSKTDCFHTFCVPIGYWTLPKVLEKDNSAALTNQIIFQPKSHLNIFGHDSTKWAPATKNQVNRFIQTFWTILVFFQPESFCQ